MPYENFHACRTQDPGKYSSFAQIKKSHNGKPYSIVIGVKKSDGKSEVQSHRYPKNSWSASEARSHCASKGGSFEAAKVGGGTDEKKSCPCNEVGNDSGCQYRKKNGRLMEVKSFPFELEKINEAGEFKAFVSTHGNIDEGNDRFNYRSWARTLSIQSGRRFPVLHCHKMDQQTGTFVARETERGLLVDGRLNLTTSDIGGGNRHVNVPKAYEVYGLMKNGDLRTFSIGWRPTKNGYKYVTENGRTIRDIFEAELIEGSSTPIPMNKMALLQEIKDISNLSTVSIINYLRKHIDDAELWAEIFEIKGYDPEQYFYADPIAEIIPLEKNTFSTYDLLFEKIVLEKYRSLI